MMWLPPAPPSPPEAKLDEASDALGDAFRHLEPTFSESLLALIVASGMTEAEVYKRANVSRQFVSKFRGNRDYRPTKPTAVAFALALRLDVDATRGLLGSAGIALTRSSAFDVIVLFFIERGVFDVFRLNEVLFAYDQPLVGSV